MPKFKTREEYEQWKSNKLGASAPEEVEILPATVSPTYTLSNPIDSREQNRKKNILIPCAFLMIGLASGYFAGREHIKYEIRSTFSAAAKKFEEGVKTAFLGPNSKSNTKSDGQAKPNVEKIADKPTKKPKEEPLGVQLNSKRYREANYQAGLDEAVTFAISITNRLDRDIRAFEGILRFTDLLDNTIIQSKLSINDPVSGRETIEWQGELNYNQFMRTHKNFRAAELENMKIYFETRKILFADGTVKEYES